MAIPIRLTVNGKPVDAQVEPNTLLVQFLREQLRLTGTHVGCDTAQCGACTVHLDGRAVKSCNMLAVQADGASVTTIEGLATNGEMHPMQQAFRECHGLQCGFCTPGMVMAATSLLRQQPNADAHAIREQLEGNLCRCTGYHNIVRAVQQGQAAMQGKGGAAQPGDLAVASAE
nr:2Fe-2S iron-sulfur cluster-binding protein [uncultured Cupriavidus sp.]